jgi:uncharacterized protein (DUF736 family)
MPYEKDENEIGELWAKHSDKAGDYMSGTINGVRVTIFRNRKKSMDKHPDWRVMKAPERSGGGF